MTSKILLCAPSEEFMERVQKIWDRDFEHERSGDFCCELEIIEITEEFNEYVIPVDADALIARGITATFLRERFHDVPVIEVPMTGVDMLHTLMRCKKMHPGKPVAVLGTPNFMLDMESYSRMLGMELHICNVPWRSKVDDSIRDLMEKGVGIVVGGKLTCEKARNMGLYAVEFMSSRASIDQALRMACASARDHMVRQHEVLSYQTMIDYIKEGIVGVDTRGKITIFNNYASQMLNISSEDAIGRDAMDTISNIKLREMLSSEDDISDEQVSFEGRDYNVSKFDVTMRDEDIGSILHIQQVDKIKQLEELIRKKAYIRGLAAEYNFEDIQGNSKVFRDTLKMAKVYAQVESNIFIEGETGTGKERFAQSIHNSSKRKQAPFVAINCAAIPPMLLESELFGYVEGAFPGEGKGGKAGVFELAHNGTIFLDEIYGLPMELQSRLLRVLQEKEIRRIGDDKQIPVNVRVIAAANRDMNKLVEAGEFRADLYYRLDVLRLQLPPLRDRGEDVILLAKGFIEKFCARYGSKPMVISGEIRKKLLEYNWPGNIRELRNVCERMCVLHSSGAEMDASYLGYALPHSGGEQESQVKKPGFKGSVKTFERQEIQRALKEFGGNKTRTAEFLGISRATLWKKIRELELE